MQTNWSSYEIFQLHEARFETEAQRDTKVIKLDSLSLITKQV